MPILQKLYDTFTSDTSVKYKSIWKTFVTLLQSIPCAASTPRRVSPDFKQEWSGNTLGIDLTWPSNIRCLPDTLPSFCYHILSDRKFVDSLGKKERKEKKTDLFTGCHFTDKVRFTMCILRQKLGSAGIHSVQNMLKSQPEGGQWGIFEFKDDLWAAEVMRATFELSYK